MSDVNVPSSAFAASSYIRLISYRDQPVSREQFPRNVLVANVTGKSLACYEHDTLT